jgi:hypothetical protein
MYTFGQHNTDWIISICFTLPKVAKASSVVTVACRSWRYRAKLRQWKHRLTELAPGTYVKVFYDHKKCVM